MDRLGNKREQALAIARSFREYARETHMADFATLMIRTADDLERFAAESANNPEAVALRGAALH